MLTEDELAALESLLVRARAAAGQARAESGGTVNVGDLVQLRPGADSHWQTSLFLVCKIRDDGRLSGIVLRPHRGGASLAHYTYSLPEVARVGRVPFPAPDRDVNSAGYLAYCPKCLGRDGSEPPAGDVYVAASLAEGQQDGGEIQIGPRLWWACSDGQQDGGEIAIGPRLWWVVVSEPKPTRKRKPAIAEVQQTLEEIHQAIEALPVGHDDGEPTPKPKPIQRERGQKQPVIHQLEQVRQLVLDAVASPYTKSQYAHALDEFFRWWEEKGRPTRAIVETYRNHLEARGLAPSTITHQLPAVRKLATLATKAGLLEPAVSAFGKGPRPRVDEMDERDALWDAYILAGPTTKRAFAIEHHVNLREFSRWRTRDGTRWIATGSTLDLRIRQAIAAQGLAEDQQLPGAHEDGGTPRPEPKPVQLNLREFSRWRTRDGTRWIATGSTLDLRIRQAIAAQGLAEDQQLPGAHEDGGTPRPEPKPVQREVGVGRGSHAARIRKILSGGAK